MAGPDGHPPPGEQPEVEPEPAAAGAVFGDRIALARGYARTLAEGGVQRGLLGPRESTRLWSRHLLNCAVVQTLTPPGAVVVDVGSGAGLPGIPLAIARPDCTVILVEPLLRRTVFLAEVVADLGLSTVRVVRGRAEDVAGDLGSAARVGADVVTSRAVAPLAKLAGWSAPLLRTGGLFLPMKGASAAEEIERDADALRALGLTDVSVVQAGAEFLDPPTSVVRAILTEPAPDRGPARPPDRTTGRIRGSRRPRSAG